MSLNLQDLNLGGAGSVSPVTLKPEPSGSGFSLGTVWGEVKDLAKFYTAAKLAPGSLTSAPVTPTTPSAPEAGKSMADVLAPVAAVYAADQANQRLNKNPPYVIYTLMGFGVLTLWIVLNRPSAKGG